ncbi:hypothetical protein [Bacillus pinisoli]|uniref:hypothetical protein n=1 Tax=Bacillus pinisoli TaxID=2901866 RepID=UPI001FF449B6|nr:hypothetical protein [Bacillus pinisoli]
MSKKKKEIHVDKVIIKADKVIIINDDDRKRKRDPWFGFLRGNREERDLDDVRDDFNDDEFDDVDDRRRDFDEERNDDDNRDNRDDEEDRRRPWWF